MINIKFIKKSYNKVFDLNLESHSLVSIPSNNIKDTSRNRTLYNKELNREMLKSEQGMSE